MSNLSKIKINDKQTVNVDIVEYDGDSASLSFIDENKNCNMQIKDGHIKTSEFDSRNILKQDDFDNDILALYFADELKNCVMQIKDGHIKTSKFDSSEAGSSDIIKDFDNDIQALYFADELKNCVMQIKDGNIKTSDFDSKDIIKQDSSDKDSLALFFADELKNCVMSIKDGHIQTKHFNSENVKVQKSFAYISNNEMTVSGSSSKSNGKITLSPGQSNRAYLDGSFECNHWQMSAKFKCTNGVSFVMGKDLSSYGAWIEIKTENGTSSYTLYNNGQNGQYSEVYSGNISFTLTDGELYTMYVSFDVTIPKIIGFELFGQYNEYFKYTFIDVTCNGYGAPFFYSNTSCVVENFSLSVLNFYDIKNAKCAVWGHSYVEGDSLASNRDKTFTNLLANAIGADKVFNFGLGGDTTSGVYSKMQNGLVFASNIQYGLVCVGANDPGNNANNIISNLKAISKLLSENGIIPIFFTLNPIRFEISSVFRTVNAYIRSNYLYVDMEQVFLNCDAINTTPSANNIRQNLYLPDKVHPTVEGHQLIFNRIMMDCPFIF